MSDPFVVLLVLIVVVVLVLKAPTLLGRLLGKGTSGLPYQKATSLVTAAERSFLGVLDSIVGPDIRVFTKIGLSDVITPRKGLNRGERQTARNKINQKHVDFVLCRADDLDILGVIELDDKSHGTAKRQERDHFMDRALKAGGVPILRLPTQTAYNSEKVSHQLQALLSPPAGERVSEPMVTEPSGEPSCPKCGAHMVVRTSRQGRNQGNQFWGCSRYPTCRSIITAD